MESEAILLIILHMTEGDLELIGSEVIDYEISKTPDKTRMAKVLYLAEYLEEKIKLDEKTIERAKELEKKGIKQYDAMHIACAEKGEADVILTTDDSLVKKFVKLKSEFRIRMMNPLEFIKEYGE